MTQRVQASFQELAARTVGLLQRQEGVCSECSIPRWYYAMDSLRPRAYGRCEVCGSIHILVLPEQVPRYRQGSPRYLGRDEFPEDPESVAASIIETSERVLSSSGVAQRIDRGDYGIISGPVMARFIGVLAGQLDEIERARSLQHQAAMLALSDAHHEVFALQERLSRRGRRREGTLRRAIASNPRPILCDGASRVDVIYGLTDAVVPDRVRYVGRTADPSGRYWQHLRSGVSIVRGWMQEVAEAGSRAIMVELERCPQADSGVRESWWIHHLREQGQADLNTSIPVPHEQAESEITP
jgi:hypothetical protein